MIVAIGVDSKRVVARGDVALRDIVLSEVRGSEKLEVEDRTTVMKSVNR